MKGSTDDTRLTAYALGEMNEQECVEFQQELAGSPELRATVSDIRQTAALLRQEFATEQALSTLCGEELLATRKIVPLPGRRRWFLAGIAAAASVAIVLAWQFWFRASRHVPSSASIATTATAAKLKHEPAFDDQDRLTLRDAANVSYGSGEFRSRQFVANLSTSLSLDVWRLGRLRFDYSGYEMFARNPAGSNEGDRFNFRVGYQLEF
jgi:hypothetical protein